MLAVTSQPLKPRERSNGPLGSIRSAYYVGTFFARETRTRVYIFIQRACVICYIYSRQNLRDTLFNFHHRSPPHPYVKSNVIINHRGTGPRIRLFGFTTVPRPQGFRIIMIIIIIKTIYIMCAALYTLYTILNSLAYIICIIFTLYIPANIAACFDSRLRQN